MQGISFKAVAIGMVAMFLLDVVGGIGLTVVLGGPTGSPGMTVQQAREATIAFMHSTGYLTGSLILGTVATVIGGYLAARNANAAPYLNAGFLGACGVVVSLLLGRGSPAWFVLSGALVVLPAALLGGHVAAGRTESRT